MKDQFNGNTEKRCPPPHLIGHEAYEMVKDVHVVLGKQKRTGKNMKDLIGPSTPLGATVLERLRHPLFD
jgi:hypothetical protein